MLRPHYKLIPLAVPLVLGLIAFAFGWLGYQSCMRGSFSGNCTTGVDMMVSVLVMTMWVAPISAGIYVYFLGKHRLELKPPYLLGTWFIMTLLIGGLSMFVALPLSMLAVYFISRY